MSLEKRVRFLEAYAVGVTFLFGGVILCGFAFQGGRQGFEEIDVERINIIEKNQQVNLVISNKERMPGPGNIKSDKFYERTGLKMPGILFYNEKGDEAGGLQFGSQEQNGSFGAGAIMTFDKYNGDQMIVLTNNENQKIREVGFDVWDQPDATPEEQKRNYDAAHKLGRGPERDALMQRAVASQRVFVGRLRDRSSAVTLFDANSRARLRMVVGPSGEPKLEFLDAEEG